MVLFIALRADNGHYICAEGGGGREVVANQGAVTIVDLVS